MIGNDIVDLRDAETLCGAQHPRFDERILDGVERAALEATEASGDEPVRRLRWTFWAAKEAAYKALRRGDPSLVFSPRRFSVELRGERPTVRTPGGVVALRVVSAQDFVAAETWIEDPAAPEPPPVVSHLSVGENEAARETLLASLRALVAPRLACAATDVDLVHSGRVPSLRTPRGLFAISLSHHGRFAAFALPRAALERAGAETAVH